MGNGAGLQHLLVLCVQEGLETVHLDIKRAFQNGKLTDVVYVSQPEELGDRSGKVWRLRKALYGLKQAAREWHKVLAELLRDLAFVRCHSDRALYVRKHSRCIIFIWVDDLLIFTTPDVMKPLCDQILARFKGRSEVGIGELGKVLGMEIMRDHPSRTMTISHRMKIKDLLDSNGMKGCCTFPTSLVPKEKLKSLKEDPSQEPATASEHQTYMKVVGSIQYIAFVTRPDLAFAAHSLARHMSASSKQHWLAAQHVMRYLQKTGNLGLQFSASKGYSVAEVYSDANFANALSLKSVSGNMLMMYGNCVFWRSKRQAVIAGDTTEAELIAMSSATNELMWLKQLYTYLSLTVYMPSLWGDSESCCKPGPLPIGRSLIPRACRQDILHRSYLMG